MGKTTATSFEQDMRLLEDNELDTVNGGYMNDNGCIPTTTLPTLRLLPAQWYHDVFAQYGL